MNKYNVHLQARQSGKSALILKRFEDQLKPAKEMFEELGYGQEKKRR